MGTQVVIQFVVSSGVKEKKILFTKEYRKAIGIIGGHHHTAVKMDFITIRKWIKEGIVQFANSEHYFEQPLLRTFGHRYRHTGVQEPNLLSMRLKGTERYTANLRFIKMATEIMEGIVMIAGYYFF
jgi:hypothetical protein